MPGRHLPGYLGKAGAWQMKTPYLSIVLASRNDNYGGGLRALQVCVSGLVAQIERHQLVSELILVDWNPPPIEPRLKDALSWPNRTDFCTVRVIEVPPSVHEGFRFSEKLPFFVHRARNVGIRRARGKFVLPTGTDILFSDALMRHLALEQLAADRMYRVDRYDVPADVVGLPSLNVQLGYCEQNVIHIYGRNGLGPTKEVSGENVRLHSLTPGDFTLLSREFWDKVYGIPEEIEFHSVYFDSVLCYMARRAGAKEEVLLDPMRIYHIEHESTSRTNKSWAIMYAFTRYYRLLQHIAPKLAPRLASQAIGILRRRSSLHTMGIPFLNQFQYECLIRKIKDSRDLFIYNDDTWGCAEAPLSESFRLAAEWDI